MITLSSASLVVLDDGKLSLADSIGPIIMRLGDFIGSIFLPARETLCSGQLALLDLEDPRERDTTSAYEVSGAFTTVGWAACISFDAACSIFIQALSRDCFKLPATLSAFNLHTYARDTLLYASQISDTAVRNLVFKTVNFSLPSYSSRIPH